MYLKLPSTIKYKIIYWRTTRLGFIPQDLFLFNINNKIYCLNTVLYITVTCTTPVVQYPAQSFIPIIITVALVATVPSLMDT